MIDLVKYDMTWAAFDRQVILRAGFVEGKVNITAVSSLDLMCIGDLSDREHL
jgi:hypothetical protein